MHRGTIRIGASAGVVMTALLVSLAASAAEWQPLTKELLSTAKPGYGGLSGVVVDHRTGHLYVNVSDRGIYRSTNQGQSWQRLGAEFKGRTEWPGCLMLDPLGEGKRMVVATVYGAPIAHGTTEGDWEFADKKSAHVDWCAVDWSDAAMRFILALKHESGGLLLVSRDGGKTFAEIGKGHGPAWIFDHDTAVVAQMKTKERPTPSLLRTTDGGKTFAPCGAFVAQALPRWHDGKLYWLVEGALLNTTDKGKSWTKISDLKDGRFGPIFGKDAQHLFVLTGGGIVESTDGGARWSKPIALPKELKGVSALTWLEYDPKNDALYVMKMRSELYRMSRK